MIKLVYIKGIRPDEEEQKLIDSLSGTVRIRTAKFWNDEMEAADTVYASRPEILAAYSKANVSTEPIGGVAAPPVAPVASDKWELVSAGGGWWDVVRGDEKANDRKLRHEPAEVLAKELNG